MKLCALLLLCGLACLGPGVGADYVSPQLQREAVLSRETPSVWLRMEVNASEPQRVSVGDSVTIRCSVAFFSDKERAKNLKIKLTKMDGSAVQDLVTEDASKGISYTVSTFSMRHSGLYSCEGEPYNFVEGDHKLIWVNDSSVNLELLRVDRVKYFYDKTLTIGCRLPNDGHPWRIMRADEITGSYTECPNQEQSGDLLTCSIPSRLTYAIGFKQHNPYWCESYGHKSNVFNVSKAELSERRSRVLVVTKFDLTPAWFVREGDSVAFVCGLRNDKKNISGKFDLQLIWTKLDPENNMKVIVSQQATKAINFTLSNITHEHSGVYSCWDDGQLHLDVDPKHHLIWVQDDSPPVTINILSHNRTQFFDYEEMTVGCQLHNDQNQWKIKRFSKWAGIINECEKSELSPSGLLSCTMKMNYPWSESLFWCESTTGLKSNALNITIAIGRTVMEAPPQPVMEGDDFTLRCLQKNRAEIAPIKSAFFFNSFYFELSQDGTITFRNVTKAREGVYSCRPPTFIETPDSYVTIKARP